MKTSKKTVSEGLTRRDLLKASGVALGGLALGGAFVDARAGATPSQCPTPSQDPTPSHDPSSKCFRPSDYSSQGYSYFFGGNGEVGLETMDPRTALDPNEMRISFMGSAVPPYGRAQMMMSVFVEVGWVQDEYFAKKNPPEVRYKAQDQFIFDCGTGSTINYNAMNVNFNRMDKVFINHLHADHMNDLGHIYCFGPSMDRKSPLFVWGPGPSGVKSPRPPRRLYDDGTKAFCENLRAAMRWHSESFSFQETSYASYKPPTRQSWGLPCNPIPVGDDPINDAYAMIPIELDWRKVGGVAYNNPKTGVKITHFPVIHARKGSIGYKLEWNTPDGHPLTMIYTSDTKPERLSIEQALNKNKKGEPQGVDVFIHEMGVPPEIWAMKILGLTEPPPSNPPWWQDAVQNAVDVQNTSHTPQGAFGYLLSQINPRPRLTVATHFPTTDDNVKCALESVREYVPEALLDREKGNLVWSYDCMVLRVYPDKILQRRALISDYTYAPNPPYGYYDTLPPKYVNPDGSWDTTGQLDLTTSIEPTDPITCEPHYSTDGY